MSKKLNLPDVDMNGCDLYESIGQKTSIQDYYLPDDDEIEVQNPSEMISDNLPINKAIEQFEKPSKEYPKIPNESLQERYDRLVWEINSLENDLQNNKQTQELNLDVLLRKMESISTVLKSSKLEHIPTDLGSIHKLTKEIEAFKSKPAQKSDQKKEMVYQLVYNPEVSPLQEKNDQLEARITNLERVIGLHAIDPIKSIVSESDLASLFSTSGTLIGALERLDHHLSLLSQPVVLEQTTRRIRESVGTLERLVELKRKLKIESGLQRNQELEPGMVSTKNEKITYLYNHMSRLDSVSAMIPKIIARLMSLQELHAEAARFEESLKVLRENQDGLSRMSESTRIGIESLVKTVLDNQAKIAQNLIALEKRMATK